MRKKVKSIEQMEQKAKKLFKEIRWLLHKLTTTTGDVREKYLQKIHNWYRAHPKEGDIVQEHFAKELVAKVGEKEAIRIFEEELSEREQ